MREEYECMGSPRHIKRLCGVNDGNDILTNSGKWNAKYRGPIGVQRYLVILCDGYSGDDCMAMMIVSPMSLNLSPDERNKRDAIIACMNGQNWVFEEDGASWDWNPYDICDVCQEVAYVGISNPHREMELCYDCARIFRNTHVDDAVAWCDEMAVFDGMWVCVSDIFTPIYTLDMRDRLSISNVVPVGDCYVCGFTHTDSCNKNNVCGDCVYAHRMVVARNNLASYMVAREIRTKLGCEDVFRVMMVFWCMMM